ncbi:MAG TPA: type II toxin-antitoxin system VapC family toxin [Thermoanaerobaculia bacterium]|nr:type II toxin-antitoxin system VapC family toxin [Thermoanaerobaculia bacterium]
MSLQYLLDTKVLSEPLRPVPDRRVLRWLEQHREETATAAPVWHELRFGCNRLPPSAKRQKLEAYLENVLGPSLPVLPYDAKAAEWHAAERARLTSAGRTPAFVDGQIAAVAAVNQLTVVTLNPRQFRPFQGLEVEAIR